MSRFTNDHMLRKQVRVHWNHIKDCDDHHDVDLTDLLSRVEAIETWIANHPDETVLLSLDGPSGGTPRDSSIVPNSVAFDSLLAGIDTMEEADLNAFYDAHISKVVSKYNDNLLAPIKVTDLPGCTVKGATGTTDEAVTWEGLKDVPDRLAKKRAYVEQFILANRSNQTRATYLTNHLVGSIALPIWQ